MKQLQLDIERYLKSNCNEPKDTFAKDAKALVGLIKKHGYKRTAWKIKVKERSK